MKTEDLGLNEGPGLDPEILSELKGMTTRYWAWARKLPVTTGLIQTYVRATNKKEALKWFESHGYEVDNYKFYKAKHQ